MGTTFLFHKSVTFSLAWHWIEEELGAGFADRMGRVLFWRGAMPEVGTFVYTSVAGGFDNCTDIVFHVSAIATFVFHDF